MAAAILLVAPAASAEEAGRKVFEESGCPTCHAVASKEIEAKIDSGPDLGTVAMREADWLASYLRKQARNGEKEHPTGFSGDDAELELLIGWLRSLGDPD